MPASTRYDPVKAHLAQYVREHLRQLNLLSPTPGEVGQVSMVSPEDVSLLTTVLRVQFKNSSPRYFRVQVSEMT
jgi:hypothetical protein